MKATFQREGLLAAFQLASAAVSAREIKPILRNLKMAAVDDRCTLMATDLEPAALKEGMTRDELIKALDGHAKSAASLVGTFSKQ